MTRATNGCLDLYATVVRLGHPIEAHFFRQDTPAHTVLSGRTKSGEPKARDRPLALSKCMRTGLSKTLLLILRRIMGKVAHTHPCRAESFRPDPRVSDPVEEPSARFRVFAQPALADLKRKSVVGGVAAVSAQVARFVVQTATMIVLARLLSPEDFGLQGMVVVVTGFLGLFRDAGLGRATIQRLEVTHQQTSTLFWINVAVGAILAALCATSAPLIAAFYHEPRLYWIAVVSGANFLITGLGAQHGALLVRAMRFVTQAKIGVLSLIAGSAVGIVMALLGCRYWSLVGMALAGSIVSTAAVWFAGP